MSAADSEQDCAIVIDEDDEVINVGIFVGITYAAKKSFLFAAYDMLPSPLLLFLLFSFTFFRGGGEGMGEVLLRRQYVGCACGDHGFHTVIRV